MFYLFTRSGSYDKDNRALNPMDRDMESILAKLKNRAGTRRNDQAHLWGEASRLRAEGHFVHYEPYKESEVFYFLLFTFY